MAATTLMALSSGVQATAAAGNAYTQSQALRSQGAYEKQQYDFNARVADAQANDAIVRGDKQANAIEKKVRMTVGEQRAAAAAQGLNPDAGSPADVQDETRMLGENDKLLITNNAWRESLGFKSEAASLRGKGAMAETTARHQANATLITGGLQFFSKGLEAGAALAKGGGKKSESESPYPSGGNYPSADDWANFYGAPK
jgi:hypothetical protein